MALAFEPISSPGATRDLFVDLTSALESGEILLAATINSGYPGVLSVRDVMINEEVVEFAGKKTEAGKGLHLRVETLQRSGALVPLVVSFEGDNGTIDTYEILQPIVSRLCV